MKKNTAIMFSVCLAIWLTIAPNDIYAEEKIKYITITGISYSGAEGDYIGGGLHETVDGPGIVWCFPAYIMDSSLTMALIADNVPWNGTGDYFVVFGDFVSKNKVSFIQDNTTIDFSEFEERK